MEQSVVEMLSVILNQYGCLHYEDIWNELEDICLDGRDHFKFSQSVHEFFESYPSLFEVHFDGRVTPLVGNCAKHILFRCCEDEVAVLLWIHLKRFGEMHYMPLSKSLKQLCHNMRVFFHKFSLSQKYHFFRDHPEFVIQNDGFVYSVVDAHQSIEKRGSRIDKCEEEVGNKELCAKDEKRYFDLENLVVTVLLEELKNLNCPVHYRLLTNKLKSVASRISKFFWQHSDSDRFWFFRKHSSHFCIENDGYVRRVVPADEKSQNGVEKIPDDFQDEHLVIILMSNALVADSASIHYRVLIKELNTISFRLRSFFDRFTDSDKFWFFKNHSEAFLIQNSGYILLAEIGDENNQTELVLSDHEGPVLMLLKNILESSSPLHYRTLMQRLRSICSEISLFCKKCPDSSKFRFFQDHLKDFLIGGDGYVSLAVSSDDVSGSNTSTYEEYCNGSSECGYIAEDEINSSEDCSGDDDVITVQDYCRGIYDDIRLSLYYGNIDDDVELYNMFF